MTGEPIHEEAADSVEQAVRAYETALGEADLGRHARSEEEPDHLHALRMRVVQRMEALPSGGWPRPTCGHCSGQLEVTAVHAQYTSGDSPEFVTSRRRCPLCWGTGLTLNLHPPDGQLSERVDDVCHG